MGIYSKRRGPKKNAQLEADKWPGTNYRRLNKKPTLEQINWQRKKKTYCCCINPDYCNQYSWGVQNGFTNYECVGCGFLMKKENSDKEL